LDTSSYVSAPQAEQKINLIFLKEMKQLSEFWQLANSKFTLDTFVYFPFTSRICTVLM